MLVLGNTEPAWAGAVDRGPAGLAVSSKEARMAITPGAGFLPGGFTFSPRGASLGGAQVRTPESLQGGSR